MIKREGGYGLFGQEIKGDFSRGAGIPEKVREQGLLEGLAFPILSVASGRNGFKG